MNQQQLIQNLSCQFPHLPFLDIRLITQTIAPLSLPELKALQHSIQGQETMEKAVISAIQQWEAEKELTWLEEQHQLWDDYYHCCGKY